jgi:ribonuclease VapC
MIVDTSALIAILHDEPEAPACARAIENSAPPGVSRNFVEAAVISSSHPAKLNFGDCFAYALAKFTGEPLLFKGDDFAHTDIRPAATER